MRTVTVADGELSWEERPDPKPVGAELLVEVHAAGVNNADLWQLRGMYPAPAGAPADIPGLELAGEVVGVGTQASRFRVGDRVMAIVGGGAQAELAVVDERSAMRVPPATSFEEAGGFPEAFCTAYDALCTQCAMSIGDRVLVTGAAGGVGTAAVQMAVAAGAYVTASVRAAEHRDALLALGATAAMSPEDALEAGPFDIAIELIGASSLPGVLRALGVGGRVSVIGVGGGAGAELDLHVLMQHRARISGSTLRARSLVEKAKVTEAVEAHVVPLLGSGRVRVPIFATYPMGGADEAYARFAEGGKLGKIVLVRSG